MPTAQALTQGWCDAKVAGTLFFPHSIYCQFVKLSSKRMTNGGARVNITLIFSQTLSRVPEKGTESEYFLYSYVCKSGHAGCSHVQVQPQISSNKRLSNAMQRISVPSHPQKPRAKLRQNLTNATIVH